MHKIQLSCFALLLTAGVAYAGTPCDGFEIRIDNKTSDDLIVNKVDLKGADIQPDGIHKLAAHTKQAFTVNNSNNNGKMTGHFEFHSISLPSKKVEVKFELKNKHLICHHDDAGSSSDYKLDKTRLPGHVKYTIGE